MHLSMFFVGYSTFSAEVLVLTSSMEYYSLSMSLLHLQTCFSTNILFRYIVQNEIPVDLGVLCKFFERLCGLLILSMTDAYKHSLHGVTMPRSWIVELWKDFDRFKGTDTRSYWLLPGIVEKLLTRLWKMDNSDRAYRSNVSSLSESSVPWFYEFRDLPGDILDEIGLDRM
jgi:hypothetical protein